MLWLTILMLGWMTLTLGLMLYLADTLSRITQGLCVILEQLQALDQSMPGAKRSRTAHDSSMGWSGLSEN